MTKYSLKSILIITLFIYLTFTMKPAEAVWQSVACNVLKELVIDTAIDVVQDLFKDKVTPKEVAVLSKRVSDLQTQLDEYDGKSPSKAEF